MDIQEAEIVSAVFAMVFTGRICSEDHPGPFVWWQSLGKWRTMVVDRHEDRNKVMNLQTVTECLSQLDIRKSMDQTGCIEEYWGWHELMWLWSHSQSSLKSYGDRGSFWLQEKTMVMAIFKEGKKRDPRNYELVSPNSQGKSYLAFCNKMTGFAEKRTPGSFI